LHKKYEWEVKNTDRLNLKIEEKDSMINKLVRQIYELNEEIRN
jgi:hypothetical protein